MTIVVEEDGTEREWTMGEMMEACDPGYKVKMTREFMTKLFLSDWYKRTFEYHYYASFYDSKDGTKTNALMEAIKNA